jgi:hypothetical protein
MTFTSIDFAILTAIAFVLYYLPDLFPPSQFERLPQPAGEWHTADGLHLLDKDERLYTAWLGDQIHAIVDQKLAHAAAKTL